MSPKTGKKSVINNIIITKSADNYKPLSARAALYYASFLQNPQEAVDPKKLKAVQLYFDFAKNGATFKVFSNVGIGVEGVVMSKDAAGIMKKQVMHQIRHIYELFLIYAYEHNGLRELFIPGTKMGTITDTYLGRIKHNFITLTFYMDMTVLVRFLYYMFAADLSGSITTSDVFKKMV